MKKNISLILIIVVLFTSFNLSIANVSNSVDNTSETIMLPKLPIYIANYKLSSRKLNNYKQVKAKTNSFFQIDVNKTKTVSKNVITDKSSISTLAGIGALIGTVVSDKLSDESPDEDTFDTPEDFLGFLLGAGLGAVIGAAIAPRKEIPQKDIYLLGISNGNKLFEKKEVTVDYNKKISTYQIKSFINDSDTFSRWNELYRIYNKYNINFNFSSIVSHYSKKISLFEKNKGEFETTSQFNERRKKEQNEEAELQAKMKQEISIAKEKNKIEKFTMLQEIKKDITEIEFTKSYDFELSDYNADRQSFTINVSNTEREIVIPISKAQTFSENKNVLSLQKTFRPNLRGKWETISDDFVLVNEETSNIIPWEGEIPTYAEKTTEFPPILSASVKLIEPSGEGYLDAKETSTIQVFLTNTGKGSAKMTRISLFQQKGPTLYYDVSNTIKEILPNESIISEFKLIVPENIENDIVNFKVSFIEEQGFEPTPLTFTAETRKMQKPELRLIDFGVEDTSGDGKISKGETVDITIRIQNVGQGKAKQVALNIIENRLDNVFIISEKQFKLGDFNSGESKDITFSISTNNRVNDLIDINFNIQEERPQFSLNEKITLEIEKTQKQLEQIVFSGKDIEKKIEYSDDLSIDIEQNIPQSNKVNENALSIIFGIENYRNVSNVNFAFRDATIMKEYFSKTIGIKEEQIYFRANDKVTLGEFRKIFSKNGWLDKRVIENKTDIYFYYAGHGAPAIKEEKAFLIPSDGDPNYPVQTGYSLEAVFENLSKLNAKSVTVFLDACFTGTNRENEMLLADARPVSIQLKNNYVKNVTVFSATSSNEISSSYPENKHGLFSYFLMKGMQGEADENNDKNLTIQELFDFTKTNVSRTAGTLDREQTPQLECVNPAQIIIKY